MDLLHKCQKPQPRDGKREGNSSCEPGTDETFYAPEITNIIVHETLKLQMFWKMF